MRLLAKKRKLFPGGSQITVILTGCHAKYKICYATHGFRVMLVMAKPSGCPFFPPCGGLSRTKCHSGSFARFPKVVASVSDNHWPKPFIF
jgi:hypothetical protein